MVIGTAGDIAWPAKAKPEFAHGVAFFSSFRDLTAAGFWTTRMGIDDLQYLGNRSVAAIAIAHLVIADSHLLWLAGVVAPPGGQIAQRPAVGATPRQRRCCHEGCRQDIRAGQANSQHEGCGAGQSNSQAAGYPAAR